MIRFGVLGAGFIGSVHAENIAAHPRAELVSVYDIEPDRARAVADENGAKVADSADVLLSGSNIDAVLIASSTPTHVTYLKAAARAGKAIFCEKPIDIDWSRTQEAAVALKKSTVPIMMGFNRRFDANYAELQRQVIEGAVGKIEIVLMTHRGPALPPIELLRVCGGHYRDSGVHFFDLLRWITNDEPDEIFVYGACLIDPVVAELGDADTSVISLRLSQGALCHIDCSRRTAYGYDERIEVFGSDGMIESRRKRRRDISLYQGRSVIEGGLYPGWFERIKESYVLELDAFIKTLEQGATPSPSLDDGLKAQAIAEAATESFKSGRPIRVSY
jgi:myo-inositol 2-dehydrogenase/D-chiro-inositol 1-dehydrogenase